MKADKNLNVGAERVLFLCNLFAARRYLSRIANLHPQIREQPLYCQFSSPCNFFHLSDEYRYLRFLRPFSIHHERYSDMYQIGNQTAKGGPPITLNRPMSQKGERPLEAKNLQELEHEIFDRVEFIMRAVATFALKYKDKDFEIDEPFLCNDSEGGKHEGHGHYEPSWRDRFSVPFGDGGNPSPSRQGGFSGRKGEGVRDLWGTNGG